MSVQIRWLLLALLLLLPSSSLATRLQPPATGATQAQVAYEIEHVPRFGGEIWFVSKSGNDANDCTNPHEACLTISHAIALASAGDAITTKAGTYAESVDLNLAALELWAEIGTVIAPAAGVGLTISGGSNAVRGHLLVTAVAGSAGVHVTGTGCTLENVRVNGGLTGFDIDSVGNDLTRCRSASPSSMGFDIGAGQNRLTGCNTAGTGTATYGYHVNSGSDRGLLENCTSVAHGTSGFYIATGSEQWTVLRCSSGAGDGRWVDVDEVNVFSGFSYDSEVISGQTFAGAGAGSENLYQITGSVLIIGLQGHVHTVLSNDIGTVYLQLYDGTNTVDVTDSPGPSFSSLPQGSLVHKVDDSTSQINIESADQVRLYEDTTKFSVHPTFTVVAKEGASTYLRVVWSGNATSGEIQWHISWEPLTHDGFVSLP